MEGAAIFPPTLVSSSEDDEVPYGGLWHGSDSEDADVEWIPRVIRLGVTERYGPSNRRHGRPMGLGPEDVNVNTMPPWGRRHFG